MKSYLSLWHLAQAGLAQFVARASAPSQDTSHDPLLDALGFDGQPPATAAAGQSGPARSYNPLTALSARAFSAASAALTGVPRWGRSSASLEPLNAPPIDSFQSGDSLLDQSAFEQGFATSPAMSDSITADPAGSTSVPSTDAQAAPRSVVPESARDVVTQLLPGPTIDPASATRSAASSAAVPTSTISGNAITSEPSTPAEPGAAASSGTSSRSNSPPPLRLEVADSVKLKQQLARELGRQVNEQVQKQIREQVTNPMTHLQAQLRALYR